MMMGAKMKTFVVKLHVYKVAFELVILQEISCIGFLVNHILSTLGYDFELSTSWKDASMLEQ